MRDKSTSLYKELTAAGTESVSLTPGSSAATASFNISGIDPAVEDMLNYASAFWIHLQQTFDADAAGSAVDFDKLYKGLQSARLFSPWLGEVFPAKHTRGAVLGHLIQVVANGYAYPQPARAQIAASTDADTTIDLYYMLPLSYDVLQNPHETAQWVGLFDQGTVDATIDTTAVYDGDYAGAVTKAPCTVRSWVEYFPDEDRFLGVPVQWREREVTGGGTSPILKSVGGETSLTGVERGCGMMVLAWLGNPTGIGLAGPDTVEKITQVEMPWRSQRLLKNTDPLFIDLRRKALRRVGPVAGVGSSPIHDGGGWPNTMAATPNNRPNANTAAMFLPLVFPGRDFKTSKAQRVYGDLTVNFATSATISSAHRFVSCELMEFTEERAVTLLGLMGVQNPANSTRATIAGASGVDGKKLRYTRIVANR